MEESRTIGRGVWRWKGSAFLALALASGCGESAEEAARRAESEMLAVLVAHHARGMEPGGTWVDAERREFLVVSSTTSGRWSVDHVRSAPDEPLISRVRTFVTGTFADGVLTLDSRLAGTTRLHLCRFRTEEYLLPEGGVRFDDASETRPAGAVFEFVKRVSGSDHGYLPGPEDEEYGREGLPR
mgnify:CR=1 FL=1